MDAFSFLAAQLWLLPVSVAPDAQGLEPLVLHGRCAFFTPEPYRQIELRWARKAAAGPARAPEDATRCSLCAFRGVPLCSFNDHWFALSPHAIRDVGAAPGAAGGPPVLSLRLPNVVVAIALPKATNAAGPGAAASLERVVQRVQALRAGAAGGGNDVLSVLGAADSDSASASESASVLPQSSPEADPLATAANPLDCELYRVLGVRAPTAPERPLAAWSRFVGAVETLPAAAAGTYGGSAPNVLTQVAVLFQQTVQSAAQRDAGRAEAAAMAGAADEALERALRALDGGGAGKRGRARALDADAQQEAASLAAALDGLEAAYEREVEVEVLPVALW